MRDAGDVRDALSRATPDKCSTFMVGSVAFVLAPRGPGFGYKTHKRLGAEFKGAHVLRRVSFQHAVAMRMCIDRCCGKRFVLSGKHCAGARVDGAGQRGGD